MSDRYQSSGDSAEQKEQAARNQSKANQEGPGIDKKLNGPNRPST
ncbi:hypothetical protein [Paenibacillus soyae]|uniref:Uncharacterized protein n=1 Tax=Paenibacillus soyae TaxID=2969249 RepID=A0A9X2MTC3_9BACL|nr:hypothetical protein [Paenibacillus soyae]MCR2806110.1 hypothetical protein [Paenibacillus soyae]